MTSNRLRLLASIGLLMMVFTVPAYALTVTFDETPGQAPATFAAVVPGEGFGPTLVAGPLTLNGGVIGIAVTPADQAASTLPNFYATSDFLALADGSLLPGQISGALAVMATSISLTIGNGQLFPGDFTLTALSGGSVIDSASVSLSAFGAAGFVGSVSVAGSRIDGFAVTSSHPAGAKLFSVDTIDIALVSEPRALASLASLAFVWLALRRDPKRETAVAVGG